jgi:gluconolactonase
MTLTEAKSQPFHVYDPEFYAIIGPNPKLSRVFSNPDYAAAHEAAVYDEPTNTLFFAANAGGPKGFSGLNSTNRVFRMNVTEAERAASTATLNADDGDYVGGNVTLHQIPSVNLENVNGGAKYNGQIAFMTEGRGDNLASQITLVNPMEPYNSTGQSESQWHSSDPMGAEYHLTNTVLLNNFFGRQFNSLNDAAYHRATGDLFFTDVDYGYVSPRTKKKTFAVAHHHSLGTPC